MPGQSYVVFGGPSLEALDTADGNKDNVLELANLDGSNGFILNGINPGDESGQSVSGAGDVDGDGVDDVIIGAANADPNGINSGQI